MIGSLLLIGAGALGGLLLTSEKNRDKFIDTKNTVCDGIRDIVDDAKEILKEK